MLALVISFSLCSCGKMTAERLVAEMITAISKEESFSGTMNTGLEMKLTVFNQSIDLSVTVDADVAYSGKTSYAEGTVTTAANGKELRTDTETYTVIGEDTVTAYTLTNGKWTKLETEKAETSMGLDTVLKLADPENMGNIILQDETDTYNGREVYVLTISDCNYAELAINTLQSQTGAALGDIDWSKLDLSGIKMQVTLKVYKDTKLPAVLVVDFGDSMTAVMESVSEVLVENMTKDMGELEKALLGKIEIQLEMPAAITTVTFDEYNIVAVEVPEEALSAQDITAGGTGIFGVLFGE